MTMTLIVKQSQRATAINLTNNSLSPPSLSLPLYLSLSISPSLPLSLYLSLPPSLSPSLSLSESPLYTSHNIVYKHNQEIFCDKQWVMILSTVINY